MSDAESKTTDIVPVSSNGHKFVPRTSFKLKVGWPEIYGPVPFEFDMRVQLVKDAEAVQKEFLMLPDHEQTRDRFHEYDVAMMAQLCVAPPEGFPDFPLKAWPTSPSSIDRKELKAAIEGYFMPDDPDAREGMKFICRGVMSRYWRGVVPADYL